MALNPKNIMKAKERYGIFKRQHPKFLAFCSAVNRRALETGTVIEVKVTSPEGKTLETNLKLTPEDVETVRLYKSK
ncbi:MAG: hypothetical protein ACOYBC_06415 [Bilifractor sp.]|jgi:hypothetical protein